MLYCEIWLCIDDMVSWNWARLFGNYSTRETALLWQRRMVAFTKPITWFCLLALVFSKVTSSPSDHPCPYASYFFLYLYSTAKYLYEQLSTMETNHSCFTVGVPLIWPSTVTMGVKAKNWVTIGGTNQVVQLQVTKFRFLTERLLSTNTILKKIGILCWVVL